MERLVKWRTGALDMQLIPEFLGEDFDSVAPAVATE
jgi:hypothetical protein